MKLKNFGVINFSVRYDEIKNVGVINFSVQHESIEFLIRDIGQRISCPDILNEEFDISEIIYFYHTK